jgi:hypothetical protein
MNFARTSVSLARKPPASSKRLSREQRHALKIMANAPRGVSEEVLAVAHGFSAEMIASLLIAGLATVVVDMKKAPRGLTIKIERIRITAEGRKMLGDCSLPRHAGGVNSKCPYHADSSRVHGR